MRKQHFVRCVKSQLITDQLIDLASYAAEHMFELNYMAHISFWLEYILGQYFILTWLFPVNSDQTCPGSTKGGLHKNGRLRQINGLSPAWRPSPTTPFLSLSRRLAGKSCITGGKKREQEGGCRLRIFLYLHSGDSSVARLWLRCWAVVLFQRLVGPRMAGDAAATGFVRLARCTLVR